MISFQDHKTPEKQIIASKETAVLPDRPDIPDELVTAVAEEAVDDELEKEVEPVETDLQDTMNDNGMLKDLLLNLVRLHPQLLDILLTCLWCWYF